MSVAHLSDRGLLAVGGADRVAFLNSLISQDVAKVTAIQPLYGCLLTPQGKYAADFFILDRGDDLWLDIPLTRLETVLQRLNMFKLRSKVTLENVTDRYRLYAAWGGDPVSGDDITVYADPRFAGMGQRLDASADSPVTATATLDDYHILRIRNGIPDAIDFELERTALLEANIDLLHGIDWHKGCYMGQELTARTHYRGLVKKRLLPFRFEGEAPAPDSVMRAGDDTVGQTRSTAGGYGLAFIKMEFADALWNGTLQAHVEGMDVTVLKPDWFGV